MQNGPELWDAILAAIGVPGMIAGGAVRDRMLGVAPKDIDVFVHDKDFGPAFNTVTEHGFEFVPGPRDLTEYEGKKWVTCVSNFKFEGFAVQLIAVSEPLDQLVESFDIALTQCWHRDGVTGATEAWGLDYLNRTLTILNNDRPDRPDRLVDRVARFRARHPQFRVRYGI